MQKILKTNKISSIIIFFALLCIFLLTGFEKDCQRQLASLQNCVYWIRSFGGRNRLKKIRHKVSKKRGVLKNNTPLDMVLHDMINHSLQVQNSEYR